MVREPTPFDGTLEPAGFHAGAAQEEALARLEWLATERERCGIVVGDEGLGKSHLLAVAARRAGGLGAEVAVLSLRGLPAGDWIELLLERLPLDVHSREEHLRPWQKLENRLRENTLMERTTALFFDDADAAPPDALEGIARLVAAVEPRFARTLVVVTTTSAGCERLPQPLRQRAAVRIELAPWPPADVAAFLAAGTAGGSVQFSPEAAETLGRFAAGVPRTICRLARLTLAAAQGDGLSTADAATVERAWRELAPFSMPQTVVVEEPSESTANPGIRVVRRLWG